MNLNSTFCRTRRMLGALALILTLSIGLCAPASAGPLDWLFGKPDAQEAMNVLETPVDEAAQEASDSRETPQVVASEMEDDGMLRVYLRSLSSPEQLHLTMTGIYAIEGDAGFRFDRDARVTLSSANGSVYMTVSGLTINMGTSVTFTRHSAAEGEENGLYIDESEKDAIFCGDLSVCLNEDGGLRPVLQMHIEDYLYGVVAYEMSDSFPLEALKAQAVAARTYAMQRKWSAGTKDYDVVDTTADQVFKGYSAEYTNVIEAVNATCGVVGVYDGGFATCYYTASNGGQTALASQIWGGTGDDGYLSMQEDIYDVENPRSLQNDLTITADCGGSQKLKQLLEDALAEEMSKAGYAAGEWEFDSIAAIEPVNPRFEGSTMYDALDFSLRISVASHALNPTDTPSIAPSPTSTPSSSESPIAASGEPAIQSMFALPELTLVPTTEAVKNTESPSASPAADTWVLLEVVYNVRLSVYDQIKDALSLGLNSSDCELISVETQADDADQAQSFKLIMRRFGHGVGMSQRGAQWMAGHYEKTWLEILGFYYPGMSIECIEWPEHALIALEDLPDSVGAARPMPTPTPTPAPLPALKDGEYYAAVTLETKSSTMNVRQEPTTSARIVDQLANGRRVVVSGEADAEGWVAIATAEISGYAKLEFLTKE